MLIIKHTLTALLAMVATTVVLAQRQPQPPAPVGLKIVVLAGEDGVNIVQTRTAVAPVVEVRDRNDVPVAGAIVRFAIQSGRASFANSARTIAVATDFSGRAAATALMPTGTGAVQIGVTASFQGQTVAATISQINVATAAEATAASSATSSGGGAAGSGAGTGAAGGGATAGAGAGAASGAAAGGAAVAGGISATTIGIIGAAVGGGALAASKAVGSDEASESSVAAGPTRYVGPFSGQFVTNFASLAPAPAAPCSVTEAISGEIDMTISVSTAGEVTGTAQGVLLSTPVSATCGNAQFVAESNPFGNLPVTGPMTALGFTDVDSGTDGTLTHTAVFAFTGSLANGVITGSLSLNYTESGRQNNVVREGRGNQNFPVAMTKR